MIKLVVTLKTRIKETTNDFSARMHKIRIRIGESGVGWDKKIYTECNFLYLFTYKN
jgi:hypothetical protein